MLYTIIAFNKTAMRNPASLPTAITNPKVPPGTADSIKRFNFDYSYWSHNVSTQTDSQTDPMHNPF